jgi:hypothetical protein
MLSVLIRTLHTSSAVGCPARRLITDLNAKVPRACPTDVASSMTSLEILELMLKLLTLIGLVGITIGVFRRRSDGGDFPLYALGFTGLMGALWIIVNMLLQG